MLSLLLFALSALGAERSRTAPEKRRSDQPQQVLVDKSAQRVVPLGGEIDSVTSDDPNIADVRALSTEALVLGVGFGKTTIRARLKNGDTRSFEICVIDAHPKNSTELPAELLNEISGVRAEIVEDEVLVEGRPTDPAENEKLERILKDPHVRFRPASPKAVSDEGLRSWQGIHLGQAFDIAMRQASAALPRAAKQCDSTEMGALLVYDPALHSLCQPAAVVRQCSFVYRPDQSPPEADLVTVHLTFVGGRLYSIDQTFANVASYVRVGKHVSGERAPDWQGALTYDLPPDDDGYVSTPRAMVWSTPATHLLAYEVHDCVGIHVRRVLLDRASAPACRP